MVRVRPQFSNKSLTLLDSKLVLLKLNFLVPVPNSDQSKAFRWKSRQGQCVVPGQVTHDGELQDSIKPVNCDSEEAIRGHWLWTEAGQVIWSEGCQKCVQSHKFNTPVHMHFCQVSQGELEGGRNWLLSMHNLLIQYENGCYAYVH